MACYNYIYIHCVNNKISDFERNVSFECELLTHSASEKKPKT